MDSRLTGKDSSKIVVWVKLLDLQLQYYNESSLYHICSVLGNVLRICPGTISLTQQRYARVCVELDVSKPMLDKVFVGTSKEHGCLQSIEYEGNNTYCSYCGLLGHVVGLCRKKAQAKGKGRSDGDNAAPTDSTVNNQKGVVTGDGGENKAKGVAPVKILKRGIDTNNNTKLILREVGLISDNAASSEAAVENENAEIVVKENNAIVEQKNDMVAKMLASGAATQNGAGNGDNHAKIVVAVTKNQQIR